MSWSERVVNCWQCGAEIHTVFAKYHCKDCDVEGSDRPSSNPSLFQESTFRFVTVQRTFVDVPFVRHDQYAERIGRFTNPLALASPA